MKKIVFSLAIIIITAALTIGTTVAYFSDTEISSDNTFTAGRLDLKFQAGGASSEWGNVNGAALFDGRYIPLNDLKPGDRGVRSARLWVDNNPSCGLVTINVYEDEDNDCPGPEGKDELAGGTIGCDAPGELNDNLNWIIWLDQGAIEGFQGNADTGECDLDYIPGSEPILIAGNLNDNKNYYFGELPTTEQAANCYGIGYCFGSWNGKNCDGRLVNNIAQTDTFAADMVIMAMQKRHFYEVCPIEVATD